MMKSQNIANLLKDIDEFLLDQYKNEKEDTKRDWRTYEQQLMNRIKGAIKNLEPLVDEAVNIKTHRRRGRPPILNTKQKGIYIKSTAH